MDLVETGPIRLDPSDNTLLIFPIVSRLPVRKCYGRVARCFERRTQDHIRFQIDEVGPEWTKLSSFVACFTSRLVWRCSASALFRRRPRQIALPSSLPLLSSD